jgi:DNA-directed RNA polymerases I, II, and III subunit RPABC2
MSATPVPPYSPEDNVSSNLLTKYERAKILGIRAEQLQRGSVPLVGVDSSRPFVAREIAIRELNEGKLPFIVQRRWANGKGTDSWKLSDMIDAHAPPK